MSKYIDIFELNAEFFDRFNNSEELVTVDRFERERKTLAGLEHDVQSAIDKIPSQENVASKEYVQESLTPYAKKELLAGYYTIESAKELEAKVDSIDLSPYALAVDLKSAEEKLGSEIKEKADITYVDQEVNNIEIPSLVGYATEQYVDSAIADIDFSGYALKSDLSKYLTIENAEDLATKSELEDYARIEDIAGFATEAYVDDKVNSIDFSKYALNTDIADLASESYVDQKLVSYATEEYVDSQISAIPKPDLNDYLTITQADVKYAQKQDLTAYATTEYVDEGIVSKADKSDLNNYLTIADSKSLATKEELSTAIESIDLSEYATTKYVDDEIAKLITDLQKQNEELAEKVEFLTQRLSMSK